MDAPDTVSVTELARETKDVIARALIDEVFRKIDVMRAIAQANGARSILETIHDSVT